MSPLRPGAPLVYGLAALPPGLSYDDPRLPHVILPPAKLRLNTEPLAATPAPADALKTLRASLVERCDPWAPAQHRFVQAYLDFALAAAQGGARALERFDRVFSAEDWVYSALRPLPRALLQGPDADVTLRVDFAFWDGERVVAVDLRERPAQERDRLDAWGIAWLKAGAADLGVDREPRFGAFWADEILPRSPFRRAAPVLRPSAP